MEDPKKHADFQSNYHRSSNFGTLVPDDDLKVKGDGELKLSTDKEALSEEEKKKIADAMDGFKERTEQTPGGEQTDN